MFYRRGEVHGVFHAQLVHQRRLLLLPAAQHLRDLPDLAWVVSRVHLLQQHAEVRGGAEHFAVDAHGLPLQIGLHALYTPGTLPAKAATSAVRSHAFVLALQVTKDRRIVQSVHDLLLVTLLALLAPLRLRSHLQGGEQSGGPAAVHHCSALAVPLVAHCAVGGVRTHGC